VLLWPKVQVLKLRLLSYSDEKLADLVLLVDIPLLLM
jgi:hypothetical protein